jgi:hypothetical protein
VTSGSKVFGQANSVESGLLENLPGVSLFPCSNLRISRNSGNMFKDSTNGNSLMIVTAKPLG